MANRFPLIIDVDDGNRIKELPAGDSLNLDGASIVNLASVSVSGEVASATLTTSGAANIGGNASINGQLSVTDDVTVTGTLTAGVVSSSNIQSTATITTDSLDASGTVEATNYTVNGQPLSSIQVQSDWNESIGSSPAFILNKPDIPVIDDTIFQFDDVVAGVPTPGDITDGYVLTWVSAGGYFEPLEPTGGGGGGVDLTAFSVVEQGNQGTGRLVYDNTSGVFTYTPPVIPSVVTNAPSGTGSLSYTSADGVFSYTPPELPANTSQLTNDGAPGGGGNPFITNTDLSVTQEAAAGLGALSYDTGVFTYTPPVIPTAVSDLTNDSNFVSIATIDAAKYLQMGDIITSGNITISTDDPADGQVTIGIDDSSYLTVESDTLATVTGRGSSTTTSITADAFTQAPTSTSTNTLKDVSIETLSILTSITSTNGNITTTNGSINATNGSVTGTNADFSNQVDGGNIRISLNNVAATNAGGNVLIDGARVDINNGILTLRASSVGGPSSPVSGDMYYDGGTIYYYASDIGTGSAGWVSMPGSFSAHGLNLPVFDDVATNTPTNITVGSMIYDENDNRVKVYNGTSWDTVGP